jgi:hypothetical protein
MVFLATCETTRIDLQLGDVTLYSILSSSMRVGGWAGLACTVFICVLYGVCIFMESVVL